MKKIICVLLALAIALSFCACVDSNNANNESSIDKEIQVLDEVNSGFDDAQKPYMDGEFVKTDSIKDCLQSAYSYALSLVDDGVAEYAKIEEENLCVICKLTQGDKVIYIPKMEDVKAGGGVSRVLTAQPYYNSKIKSDAPDKAATRIDLKIESYSFNNDDNLDDKEVNLDSLKKLKGTKVIIWDGHGGYDSEDHSFIGVPVSYKSLKTSEKYSSACNEDQILESTDGDALLTSKFLNSYFNSGDLDGTVIYLGTCSSGRDSVFADTLISKGAIAVFGNTYTTQSGYDGRMIESIFSAMADGKTAKEALKIAKNKNGEKGPLIIDIDLKGIEIGKTEVKLFGKNANGYRLYKSSAKADNWEEAAKELIYNFPNYGYDIDLSVNSSNIEIIDLDANDIPEIIFSFNTRVTRSIEGVYYFNGKEYVAANLETTTTSDYPDEGFGGIYPMYPIFPATDSNNEVKYYSNSFLSVSDSRVSLDRVLEGSAAYYIGLRSFSQSYTFSDNTLSDNVLCDLTGYVMDVEKKNEKAIDSYITELENFNNQYQIDYSKKFLDVSFSLEFNDYDEYENNPLDVFHKTITDDTVDTLIEKYNDGEHEYEIN